MIDRNTRHRYKDRESQETADCVGLSTLFLSKSFAALLSFLLSSPLCSIARMSSSARHPPGLVTGKQLIAATIEFFDHLASEDRTLQALVTCPGQLTSPLTVVPHPDALLSRCCAVLPLDEGTSESSRS